MAVSRGSSSVIKESDSLHLSIPPAESLLYLQAPHSAPPHCPPPSCHTIQLVLSSQKGKQQKAIETETHIALDSL